MRNREEDLQYLPVAHDLRIEYNFHGFGMTGAAAADSAVICLFGRSAGIAGNRGRHALHVLVDALHTPKTSAGKDDFLHPYRIACRGFNWRRNFYGGFRRARTLRENRERCRRDNREGRGPDEAPVFFRRDHWDSPCEQAIIRWTKSDHSGSRLANTLP